MKRYIILIILGAFALGSCKKVEPKLTPLASLNVTNAVNGGATLTLNTQALTIPPDTYAQFSLLAGESQVNIGVPAAAGTPAVTYYNQTIPTVDGSYYSLFLSGPSPASVDATLIKESYQNYTDSLCGVRFINLVPGSAPVSVDIAGKSNGSEVLSLAYKAYSIFKQYPANTANPSYSFEFRDAASGILITGYSLTTPYFHNVTLALTGPAGGPYMVVQVNEF